MSRITPVFLPGFSYQGSVWENVSMNIPGSILQDLPILSKRNSLNEVSNQLIQSLPDRCCLVGWSLGGLVALHMAALFPEKINAIVLVCTNPCFIAKSSWPGIDAAEARAYRAAFRKNPIQVLSEININNAKPQGDDEVIAYFAKHQTPFNQHPSWHSYLDILYHHDLVPWIKASNMPMLHIAADCDPLCDTNVRNAIASICSDNFQCELLKGAGHGCLYTHAEEITQMIMKFTSRTFS